MNWETIIVALVTGGSAALIGLAPVYRQMRKDRDDAVINQRRTEVEIAEIARKAALETIDAQNKRIDELEEDLEKERSARKLMQQELENERMKRRSTEIQLEAAELEIESLKKKVQKLEKRDTGELKPPES